MGMDVYGKNATVKEGEYFRNTVWWWRALWDYCETLYQPCQEIDGHSNGGDGLNAEQAKELGLLLLGEINSGRAKMYQDEYEAEIAAMPDEPCDFCKGVGIVQVHESWPDYVEGEITFRDPCNACKGKKTQRPWQAMYPFDVENVREFAYFCIHSGGFEIC